MLTASITRQCSKCLLAGFLIVAPAAAQEPSLPAEHREEAKRLPNGRLQSDEILKADHESNLKDLAEIRRLTDNIEAELKKNDRHVLSLKNVRDLEQIEKLARRVRGRMQRY